MTSPLEHMLADLRRVSQLPDGWYNGDGSAVDRDVLEFTRDLLTLLFNNGKQTDDHTMPPADITPLYPDSGVDVFWPSKGVYLTIGSSSGFSIMTQEPFVEGACCTYAQLSYLWTDLELKHVLAVIEKVRAILTPRGVDYELSGSPLGAHH